MRNSLNPSDRLAHPWTIALLLSVVIVIALPSGGEDVTPTGDVAIENLHGPGLAAGPHQGGMRVYLDEDGRPTLPPADSPGVSRSRQTSRPTEAELEPLTEINAPGGGTMVILDGRFDSHSTAQINPDGTVSVECKRSAADSPTLSRDLHGHGGSHPGAADPDGLEGEQRGMRARPIGPGACDPTSASASPDSCSAEVLQ